MLYACSKSSLQMTTLHLWKSCLIPMATNKLYAADVTNRLLPGSSKWQTNKLQVFPEQSTGTVPTLHQGLAQQRHTPSFSKLLRSFWLKSCYMHKRHSLDCNKDCSISALHDSLFFQTTIALLSGCSAASLLHEQQ